jgi:pentatricopeptide repeat domain-containing protein 1
VGDEQDLEFPFDVEGLRFRVCCARSDAAGEGASCGTLEARGVDVADWLLSDAFRQGLFGFFPCAKPGAAAAATPARPASSPSPSPALDDRDASKELAVEARCKEAFAAVQHFEETHCLALQNMGFVYLQRRGELVLRTLGLARELGLREEAAHDAVLLLDRTMSTQALVRGGNNP